jgi:pimeloyl-ACP methyl ester carboxylesterase
MTSSWTQSTARYGSSHDRQVLSLCLPESPASSSNPLWIVFIHGGGWRDPRQTHKDFDPALNILLSGDLKYNSTLDRILGFASIDYGLSKHPSDPNDPGPALKHPQHVQDVCDALKWLANTHGVGRLDSTGDQYILIGHSAGATMAYQIAMGIIQAEVKMPLAVVGIAGIYDILCFVDDPLHPDRYEPYKQMIVDAFGEDEKVWKSASPALREDLLIHKTSWDTKIAWLFHSDADELVEPDQSKRMLTLFEKFMLPTEYVVISGEKHEEAYRKGSSLVKAIQKVVDSYE